MKVAIVGATGAVGVEFMQVLERRNFPVTELVLLASKRSAGTTLTFKGKPHVVKELTTIRSSAASSRCSAPAPKSRATTVTAASRPAA